eukprot:11091070-Prorocentrum_lima.AAC.1
MRVGVGFLFSLTVCGGSATCGVPPLVVDGLPEYLSVRETVATAFLHIVQNVGHALVHVLGRVAYLSPIGRLYLAEKEVHEIPPCVLVQFV